VRMPAGGRQRGLPPPENPVVDRIRVETGAARSSDSAAPRASFCRHRKPSGRAVVTLSGHDIYLGKWIAKISRAE
ncbi:MAG: hypothetical protein ACYSWU_25585, partial [Planctomycetota bacterium]